LFSGPDGTELLGRLAAEAGAQLEDAGFVAFEVGTGQSEWLSGQLAQAGLAEISVHRDAAGLPRVVCASRQGGTLADTQAGGKG
jgi:methylase of polypeptide subunit release factors